MKISNIFNCAVLIIGFATGCASNKEIARIEALRRDPAWPDVHATAEKEIARREGNTRWSSSAYYSPKQHTNGVWAVVAWGAYPDNTLGDRIDICIRDNGQVISYEPRMSGHAR